MIIKWDGVVTAGSDFNLPVNLMDIFSTSLASAGIRTPDYVDIDGIDLLPFMNGDNSFAPHEAIFWRTDFNKAVRKGAWKPLINGKRGRWVPPY